MFLQAGSVTAYVCGVFVLIHGLIHGIVDRILRGLFVRVLVIARGVLSIGRCGLSGRPSL